MSALVLTAGARPIFLTEGFLKVHADDQGDVVCSAGNALRHRLRDMDPASLWQGEAESDATTETITFGLWEPGMQTAQDVKFLAVLNHNLASFDWDLSDDNGGTYPGANQQAITAQTTANHLLSLATAIEADKIKFSAKATQTANAFKQVGCLIAASEHLQMPIGMSLFERKPYRFKHRGARMYDNSIRREMISRSDAGYHFRDFAVGFAGLTESQADALEAVLVAPDPFIFLPEPGDRPGLAVLGHAVIDTITRNYSHLSRSGGETMTFDFEETGGS